MLCGVAPTAGLLVAARVLQAVGAAALVPVVAGPRAADLPALEDPGRGGHLGCRRCRRRRGRTDARRPRRREPRLALGLLHQPAGRDRQLRRSAAGCCPKGARRTPAGCPTRSVSCCWPAGWRWPPTASCRPTTWGWTSASFVGHDAQRRGAGRALRVALPQRRQPAARPVAVRVAHRSAGPTPARSSSRSGSTRCSSATCCSSRGVGLLDPGGRPRDLGRSADRGGDGAVLRPARRAGSASDGSCSPAASSGPRAGCC